MSYEPFVVEQPRSIRTEPCESCAARVVVMTSPGPRRLMEVDEFTPGMGGLQPHTPERCRALRPGREAEK